MPLDINQLCAKYADQLETCGNCQNGKQYIISICELDPTFDGMCGEFVEWIIQNILSDANFYDNYCSDGEIVEYSKN